jgi:hypothetical protein
MRGLERELWLRPLVVGLREELARGQTLGNLGATFGNPEEAPVQGPIREWRSRTLFIPRA